MFELADAVLINKADGENLAAAERACADYERALHYIRPATDGWQTRAYTASAASVVPDGTTRFAVTSWSAPRAT